MTHGPVHALYLGSGALYFVGALYFAFRNYRITKHDGFWFFMMLFTVAMTGVMITGALWSADLASEEGIHPYYDIFFLIASILLFVAAYSLHKKHHEINVF